MTRDRHRSGELNFTIPSSDDVTVCEEVTGVALPDAIVQTITVELTSGSAED